MTDRVRNLIAGLDRVGRCAVGIKRRRKSDANAVATPQDDSDPDMRSRACLPSDQIR
jgi:hypothetical protein